MKSVLVLLILLFILVELGSEGKHVFSFIDSNRDSSSYGVINIRCVSKQMEINGVLEIPQQEKYYDFNATSSKAATVVVPEETIPYTNGIQLTTVTINAENDDVDLLVYAQSYTPEQESFMVLPSEALGRVYYVMSFRSNQGNGAFSISPIDVGTDVDVYFNQDFSFGGEIYNMNNPYRAILSERTLHFQTSFDPTGTRIETNKKVQVVSGNDCAGIPSSTSYCNHISEALLPVDVWGRSFAVAPFHDRSSGYLLRILASADSTDVSIHLLDRTEQVTLDAGGVKERLVAIPEVLTISATQPVLVAQFMLNPIGTDLDNGGPAMVIVPAIEHSISTYLPFTSLTGFASNHVTVWLSSFDVDGLQIDNTRGLPWMFVGPAFGGAIVQTTVSSGEHYLSHASPSVRLCGIAYGYDSYVSYAHPIYFQPLTATAGDGTSPLTIESCPGPIIAECPSDSNVATVTWTHPTVSTSSPLLPITSNYQSGDSFGIGSTKVRYKFTNVLGNEAVCTFQVEIKDVTPPEIYDCPSNFSVVVCDTSPEIKWREPYAVDNSMEGYHVIQTSIQTNGGNEIRYDFWDKSGNEATCSFKIETSYPNDCKTTVKRSSLETAAVSLGLSAFVLLMLLCCPLIWGAFNKYMKKKSLSRKSDGKKSRNYYKTNPVPAEGKVEAEVVAEGGAKPNQGSLYVNPKN